MLERNIESALQRRVKQAGGISYKLVCPSHTGMPDRLIVFPTGRVSFAELKRPDGKGRLTARQKKEQEKLTALGCVVRVIETREQLEQMILEETEGGDR